jgi:hypothetical protein
MYVMKQSLLILIVSFLSGWSIAQPCIDPSLINPDAICTTQYDPVCGCNGITYSNSCVAVNSAGVTSWTPGECGGGPIMADPCTDLAGIDFGFCAQFLGYALVNGTCTPVSGCGYVVGNIDYTLAFSNSMEDCDLNCGGLTYADECADVEGIDFGPCDMFLGYATINGVCTSISGCGYVVGNVDYTAAFVTTLEECNVNCVGVVPSEECEDLTEVDFGECAMPLGIGIINGNCEMISGCSAIVGTIDYTTSLYDNMDDCEACLSSNGLYNKLFGEIRIHPNPAEDVLKIDLKQDVDAMILIKDLTGRDVGSVSQNGQFIELDLSALNSGQYFLEININGMKMVRSIIKK